MTHIYVPNTSLTAKIKRRLARFQAQRIRRLKLDTPIVSFSFDDCPKSVIPNALTLMEAEGWQATIYVAAGLCGITNHLGVHMSEDDVKAVCKSGHEIGDHTYSHCDGFALPTKAVLADIDKNQAALGALGIPASQTFAYPYGELTPALKKALESRFKGARGIHSQTHERVVDMNQIGSSRLYSGADFDTLLKQIMQLKDNPGWMTIFTHDVRETPSAFGCTPAQFRTVIDAVKDCGARVMPLRDATDIMEATS